MLKKQVMAKVVENSKEFQRRSCLLFTLDVDIHRDGDDDEKLEVTGKTVEVVGKSL